METVTSWFFKNSINNDNTNLIAVGTYHPLDMMEFNSYFTCFLVIMEQRKP